MTKQESRAINSLRFICIVFLVLLHTQVLHLADVSISATITKWQNFVSIAFLQILFVISGFLFFYKSNTYSTKSWLLSVYPDKLRKRIKTLLIPYIIWCVIAIIYNYYVKHIQVDNVVMQFWDAGSGNPVGKAMWYIRSLIVFSVLSPLYYWAIRIMRHFTILLFLFLTEMGGADITFPYFNEWLLLGSYLAVMDISISKISTSFDWRICLICYFAIKFVGCFLPVPLLLSKVLMFVLCFWGLWGMCLKWTLPTAVTVSSSFIYFVHPYFTGIRNIYMKFVDKTDVGQVLFVWFITAASVFCICYCLFVFGKRYAKKIVGVLTGERV